MYAGFAVHRDPHLAPGGINILLASMVEDAIIRRTMKLLTKGAGDVLNLSADMVRKLERQGKLKAERTADGTRLFDPKDVDKLAKERAAKQKRR